MIAAEAANRPQSLCHRWGVSHLIQKTIISRRYMCKGKKKGEVGHLGGWAKQQAAWIQKALATRNRSHRSKRRLLVFKKADMNLAWKSAVFLYQYQIDQGKRKKKFQQIPLLGETNEGHLVSRKRV